MIGSDLFTLQLTVDLPINKDKLQNRRIAEARLLAAAAQNRLADSRRALDAAFAQSWAEWSAAAARLRATTEDTLPALRGTEQARTARFGGGGGNLIGVQVASENVTAVSLRVVEERASLARATADLLYYIGECAG